MADFVEGEWPRYIGQIIIWFANVDAQVDTLIEQCGSKELRRSLRDDVLKDRAQRARKLSLDIAVDDESRAEIGAAFDELDRMIDGVRNHVAHPIPTFVLTQEVDGALKLGFRRRRADDAIYMSLAELKKAVEDSEALVVRFRALVARVAPKRA